MLLLRTRGRRTGLRRDVPLGYVIRDGVVYCVAGYGAQTPWFRNLLADPEVEVVLPGRTIRGRAEPVVDPVTWLRAYRALIASFGLVGRLVVSDPSRLDDATLLATHGSLPGDPHPAGRPARAAPARPVRPGWRRLDRHEPGGAGDHRRDRRPGSVGQGAFRLAARSDRAGWTRPARRSASDPLTPLVVARQHARRTQSHGGLSLCRVPGAPPHAPGLATGHDLRRARAHAPHRGRPDVPDRRHPRLHALHRKAR